MITMFCTAKPFHGHIGVNQRNALQSWKLLHPDAEVILFGDDEGASEVCRQLGLRHEPYQERHESGMKYLDFMFKRAQEIARHEYLCYLNCDIVLMDDFWRAFQRAVAWNQWVLLIGQRWDTDINAPIDFSLRDWQTKLREVVRSAGTRQIPDYVDYFAFPKGLYDAVPPLLVGRSYWDWWLVWKALDRGARVVDCGAAVMAVHQNHSYGYHPLGKQGTNQDDLALRNVAVSGGMKHLKHILDATHKMNVDGRIRRVFFRRQYYEWRTRLKIQSVINVTYPIRRILGLRRNGLRGIAGRTGEKSRFYE